MRTDQEQPVGRELGALPAGEWVVDPTRSEIGFAVKVMGLMAVRGVFDEFTGILDVTGADAVGALTVQAASLNTRNRRRDQHLRSADFFDAIRYPAIRFSAAGATAGGTGMIIAGELEIGSARTLLEIPATAARLDDGALRIVGKITVSRKAVGLTWNWLGTVSDKAALHAALTLASPGAGVAVEHDR